MACIAYLHYPKSLCTVSYTPVTSAKRLFQLHICLTLGSSRRSGFTDSNGGVGQGGRFKWRSWAGGKIQMEELGRGEDSKGGVGGGGGGIRDRGQIIGHRNWS